MGFRREFAPNVSRLTERVLKFAKMFSAKKGLDSAIDLICTVFTGVPYLHSNTRDGSRATLEAHKFLKIPAIYTNQEI